MKAEFFDTHAHLDFPDFAGETEQIVARAEAAGITRIITIGTTLEGSLRAVEIAERFPHVYAAVGWHPSHVTEAPDELSEELRRLADHPKVVAIGECGLDYSRLPSSNREKPGTVEEDANYKVRQAKLFRQQLELAAEKKLNVIVHQRDSFADSLEVLRPYSSQLRAVFHCFVGSPDEQRQVAELGHLVSFTGIATFKNAAVVRETVKATPLGSFMLETDAPFLAPVPYRGKRCEPAHVADTAAFIAKEKGCTLLELSEATCRTAKEFFGRMKAS
ncbi:MAG TPA: TatD family hydrolase [Verrucomicrobiae bacterium]